MELIINPLAVGVLGLSGLAFAALTYAKDSSGHAMNTLIKLASAVTLVIAPSLGEGTF